MFRPAAALGILLISTPGVAQDPAAADTNRVKVEIDNPQVRALRVKLGPNEKIPAANYRASVAIFLTDGRQRVGPGANDLRKRADAVLLPAGKHEIENLGSAPSEIVVVEFKTPPVKPWKAVALDPVKVDPNNFQVITENDYARVLRATSKPPKIEHEHGAYLFVALSGDGIEPGAVRFENGPAKHSPQNNGDNVMVEFKTQQPSK